MYKVSELIDDTLGYIDDFKSILEKYPDLETSRYNIIDDCAIFISKSVNSNYEFFKFYIEDDNFLTSSIYLDIYNMESLRNGNIKIFSNPNQIVIAKYDLFTKKNIKFKNLKKTLEKYKINITDKLYDEYVKYMCNFVAEHHTSKLIGNIDPKIKKLLPFI
jgi:hypothetical protein